MTEQNFLKKLNILYVEDDESIRTHLDFALNKLVNHVYVCKNGLDALEKYNNLKKEKVRLDAIISDINMPKLDGIALLEKIRKDNEDLPFIFTTAYAEEKYLLDAIKLNTTAYILKPFDIHDLINKLHKVCKSYHQNDTIRKQKIELERYLSVIDNVAIVSKTDLKGNIIFANDIFCEIAKYSREELYGKPHNIVRHPDMAKTAFSELWKTIKSGNTWHGKIKNRAKDGTPYYVNSTVIPVYDDFGDDIVEYVGIRFLTTNDELEKREFKRKVLLNIQDSKKKESDNIKQIKLLEDKLMNYHNTDIDVINRQLFELKEKSLKLAAQINHYESEIKDVKIKNNSLTSIANQKVKKASMMAIELKKLNNKFLKENNYLKDELKTKENVIIDFEKRVTQKNKYIEDLKDVISFKEQELERTKI